MVCIRQQHLQLHLTSNEHNIVVPYIVSTFLYLVSLNLGKADNKRASDTAWTESDLKVVRMVDAQL